MSDIERVIYRDESGAEFDATAANDLLEGKNLRIVVNERRSSEPMYVDPDTGAWKRWTRHEGWVIQLFGRAERLTKIECAPDEAARAVNGLLDRVRAGEFDQRVLPRGPFGLSRGGGHPPS